MCGRCRICTWLEEEDVEEDAAEGSEDRAKCFMPLGFAEDGRPCEALDEGRFTVVGGSRNAPDDEG